MTKELQQTQEKLKAIDSLTNCISKLSAADSKEIAYLMHRIAEAEYLDSNLAREVTRYKLKSNSDLFVKI